jgi:hypothetical protein
MPLKVRRDTPFECLRHGEMAFPTAELFASAFRVNGFFIFGGHISRQFRSIFSLRELPGSVAGVYKWLLTPGRWPFWCFWGCFVAKNPSTPTQEVL